MNPYPRYKPAGIEWIDELPVHWITSKLAHFSRIKTGGTPEKAELEYWDNGTINWMTSGEVNGKYIYSTTNKITEKGMQNSNANLLPAGSVMMALSGQGKTKGTVAILRVPSSCSQSLAAIICDDLALHHDYLLFYLESNYKNLRGLVGDDLRDGLNLDIVGQIRVPLPPLSEQQAIAAYLYEKTRKIDTLIEKKQRLIELLKEQRTGIINHAVTKGINPNVKMKDSGFDWLGEIPEHWEVLPFRRGIEFLTDFEANGSFADLKENIKTDSGNPYAWYVRATDLESDRVGLSPENRFCDEETYRYLSKTSLFGGELLVTKRGEIGKVYLMPKVGMPATLAPNLYLVRLNDKLHPPFVYTWFLSGFGNPQLVLANKSTTIGALYKDDIKDCLCPFPPLEEQKRIFIHIDEQTKRVDGLVRDAEHAIQLLQEYRTALISAVVTGKIDVRDYLNGKSN
jgi:type I restriction enzyme S subunit